jgi:hypothetical protein
MVTSTLTCYLVLLLFHIGFWSHGLQSHPYRDHCFESRERTLHIDILYDVFVGEEWWMSVIEKIKVKMARIYSVIWQTGGGQRGIRPTDGDFGL